MTKSPFIHFPKFVLRSPLLPLNFYHHLTEEELLSEDKLKEVCSDPVIQEALFLASPSLHDEFKRWSAGEIKDPKEAKKMVYSVMKYLSRMSSRCTPFGLFAGTAVGHLREQTGIELAHYRQFDRHTRLDMNYLVALSQDMAKKPEIAEQLSFFPNSSVYRVGPQLRFIEYSYHNSRRHHQMISVDNNEYLQEVLKAAAKGQNLGSLAEVLVGDDISKEEALAYIEELVNSQLLVSELEPAVSGPEFLDQLVQILSGLKGTQEIVSMLNEVKQCLHRLDQKLGNPVEDYLKISESLKPLGTRFELKYLFQTDLKLVCKQNHLGTEIYEKVLRAFSLLNRMSLPYPETRLNRFGKAVYERYESEGIPLAHALDTELGISYKDTQGSGDVNVLIDDLVLPMSTGSGVRELKQTEVHVILHKKLIESLNEENPVIQLTENDFKHLESNWNDLPETVSTMAQLVVIDDETKVILSAFAGSSAANLMARFCHGDQALHQYVAEIIALEEKAVPDKILAEVVHLPEARVGNVLMRPGYRKFEIPYLAKSVAEDQLNINDLMIKADYKGRVYLRSRKHGNEVVPRITNAHNFSGNALPVYNFLGDLQQQGKRSVGFSWGPLANQHPYLPRVEYEGVIFSEATWNISKRDVQDMLKASDDTVLKVALEKWKKRRKLPQFFLLVEGDNELLINSENLTSIRMLLATVSKHEQFKLCEFLHHPQAVVNQGEHYYTNQFILSFFNQQKL